MPHHSKGWRSFWRSKFIEYIKDKKDVDPAQYLGRFGSRVMHMRDDLDQNGKDSPALDAEMYGFGGKRDDMQKIADEIEKLANHLQDEK